MKVQKRHGEILELLINSDVPVSGTHLSKTFNVSRQIIVQDINQLRDDGNDIISTTRGYILRKPDVYTKIFKVYHTVEDTEKELNIVVDMGGEVKDVFIYHRVYNEIRAGLSIRSRKDVKEFCENIKTGKSTPLMTATGGYHYHTIVARDYETLELIEKDLKANGFLAELTEFEPDSLVSQNNRQ